MVELDIYDRAILRILRSSPVPLTANRIARILRISATTTTRHLTDLKRYGFVDYMVDEDTRVPKTRRAIAREMGRSSKGKRGRTHRWYLR